MHINHTVLQVASYLSVCVYMHVFVYAQQQVLSTSLIMLQLLQASVLRAFSLLQPQNRLCISMNVCAAVAQIMRLNVALLITPY